MKTTKTTKTEAKTEARTLSTEELTAVVGGTIDTGPIPPDDPESLTDSDPGYISHQHNETIVRDDSVSRRRTKQVSGRRKTVAARSTR